MPIWKMSWQFKCFDPQERDLCTNGGTCAARNSTGEEFCVCPAGSSLGRDFDWFHFPNCSRHVDASLYFFIQYTILASFLCVAYVKLIVYDFKSDARIIAMLAFGFLFALIWFVLSFYVQEGCYEGCSIFSNISFFFADLCCGKFIVVVMRPLYLMQNESLRQFRLAIWTWTALLAVVIIAIGILMASTCRMEDSSTFNIAAMLSTGLLWVGGVTQISFTLIASYRLKQKLQTTAQANVDSNNNASGFAEKSKNFIRRIKILQVMVMTILVPFLVLLIAVPIVLSNLSSFPYYYIIEYLEIEMSLIFCLAILLFLKQQGQTITITGGKNRTNSSAISSGSKLNQLGNTHQETKTNRSSKESKFGSFIRSSHRGVNGGSIAVLSAAESSVDPQ